MEELNRRRALTNKRIEALQNKLTNASGLVRTKACVYATGSMGRRESCEHSDLDLIIAGISVRRHDEELASLLPKLDEICVKADLIRAARELKLPKFDADGRFLVQHPVHLLTATLGQPEDDLTNTFTARLLLLLESYPLLERDVYKQVINQVLSEYWRDYEDHKANFKPAFLANDILRLWRTFCVNYEANTSVDPPEKKAKRKLKNYKLKHSRLLTCYSAILHMLAIYNDEKTVTLEDALQMVELSPTERLELLSARPGLEDARASINSLLESYEKFLVATNFSEQELVERFTDPETRDDYLRNGHAFGNFMYSALMAVGKGSEFHQFVVV